jgi:phage regulator Rha-like protein
MTETASPYAVDEVIQTIRGHKVILDVDLARVYGVETKNLNKAIHRNNLRFPEDFVFQLSEDEFARLRFQNGTSKMGRGGRRYLPYAFTEHGAIMAATVLNSTQAVEMSVFVVRAFVKMREQLIATATMAKQLAEVEKLLMTHDSALRDLYQKIRPLLLPPPDPPKRKIGFGVREARSRYSPHSHSKKAP